MQVSRWWKYLAIVASCLVVLLGVSLMMLVPSALRLTSIALHDDTSIFLDHPDPPISYIVGMVFAMRGKPEDLPTGWMPCDGRLMDRKDYPMLHGTIGSYYSDDWTEFRLPDYRGMFAHRTKETPGAMLLNLNIGRPAGQKPSGLWFTLLRDSLGKSFDPVLWAIRVK